MEDIYNDYPLIQPSNPIHSPSHYQSVDGLECREVQRNFVPKYEKYGGQVCYDVGNVIKYILRAPDKNGLEDLLKAKQYLDWIIEEVEENNEEN